MRRAALWAATTALVVLASRTVAYAVAPSPLALHLRGQVGGPRLWIVAVLAVALGFAVAAAVVWLAALGVEEQRRLEPRPVLDAPRLRLRLLAVRAAALAVASSTGFVLLESTLHWRAGLGWHGVACLHGPVHRSALPILVALSLVAAACVAAADHVVAWLRRTLARLAPVVRLPRLVLLAPPPAAEPFVVAAAPLAARGPPLGA